MQEFYCTEGVVTDMLDRVAECAGGSSDVLAKIGFVPTSRGYWSYGMRFFIEALKARERVKTARFGGSDIAVEKERGLARCLLAESRCTRRAWIG